MNRLYECFEALERENCEIMLYHQGLGETACFLQLLYKYKEKTGHKLLTLTLHDARTELMRNCPYVDSVIQLEPVMYNYLSSNSLLRQRFHIKNVFDLHAMPEIKAANPKSVIEELNLFLNLPRDTPLKKYNLNYPSSNVERLFDQYHLKKGKSVFIVPHALCFGDNVVPIEFWQRLAEELEKQGYDAVFNSGNPVVPEYVNVFLPICEAIIFAQLCGCVVGVRTGFMDLIGAFTNIPTQIIYPSDDNPIWYIQPELKDLPAKTEKSKFYMQDLGYSVKTLFKNKNVSEYVYQNIEFDLAQILSGILD